MNKTLTLEVYLNYIIKKNYTQVFFCLDSRIRITNNPINNYSANNFQTNECSKTEEVSKGILCTEAEPIDNTK